MEQTLGTLALLLSAAAWWFAMERTVAANPDTTVPQFWGRPAHFPTVIYLYRLPAVILLLAGIRAWLDVLGVWSCLLLIVIVIPSAIVNTRHNRRIERLRTPSRV